jgi:hypothetical protein
MSNTDVPCKYVSHIYHRKIPLYILLHYAWINSDITHHVLRMNNEVMNCVTYTKLLCISEKYMLYEGRLKSSWTGKSAHLLCRGGR